MHPYEFSPDDLEKIRLTILDDFEKMNPSSGIGDYPAFPEPRKCMSSQFGRVCPELRMGEFKIQPQDP